MLAELFIKRFSPLNLRSSQLAYTPVHGHCVIAPPRFLHFAASQNFFDSATCHQPHQLARIHESKSRIRRNWISIHSIREWIRGMLLVDDVHTYLTSPSQSVLIVFIDFLFLFLYHRHCFLLCSLHVLFPPSNRSLIRLFVILYR